MVAEKVTKEQFIARFKDHQKQVAVKKQASKIEEEAFKHDMRLHPQETVDGNGRPLWNGSAAQLLLRHDISEGVHDRMPSGYLYLSRPEYAKFSLKVFREHIGQEINRQKFNRLIELKREAKKAQALKMKKEEDEE